MTSGNIILTYRGHSKAVSGVTWSPDGSQIASGSYDKQVHILAAGNGVRVFSSPDHQYRVSVVAWSPDGQRIAAGNGNRVDTWDVATGDDLISYPDVWGAVEDIAWSPDGRYLAAASASSRVQIWSVASGKLVFRCLGYPSYIWAVAWSPDGQRIAFGTGRTIVQEKESRVYSIWIEVWEVATKTCLVAYRYADEASAELVSSNYVSAIAWSPDGRWIGSANRGEVQVWDAVNGVQRCTYKGHSGWVGSLAWSPDSSRIASGGSDKTVQIWRPE